MKTLLATCLIVGASFATSVWAGEMSALILPYTADVTGDVLESGANARTAAEIVAKAAELNDLPVRVLGKVVTVTGVVRTDKDFGSGYSYKVLIEEATLKA